MDLNNFLPFMGAMIGGIILIAIVLYVYSALALMSIAKRTKTENAWLAWIPIANVYLMTQIAEIHPAWTLAVLLPLIPVVGGLAMIVVMVYIWWLIAETRNKPGWWSILMILPVVNLVIMGILAWGE